MYYCSNYTIVTSMYLLKMNVIGKSFRELADKVIRFYLYTSITIEKEISKIFQITLTFWAGSNTMSPILLPASKF